MKKLFVLFAMIFLVIPFSACGKEKDVIVVTGVSFLEEEVFLSEGQSDTLSIKVYPNNATNRKVEFSSSNVSAVSVDENGIVTMNGNQPAVITVRTVDGGKTASCLISPAVSATGLSFSSDNFEKKYSDAIGSSFENQLMLSVGQEKQLKINFTPSNATSIKFSLVSSNSTIVKVIDESNAIIRGLRTGKVTLSATVSFLNDNNEEEVSIPVTCEVVVVSNADHFEVSMSSDKFATDNIVIDLTGSSIQNGSISVKLSDFASPEKKLLLAINLEAADNSTKINQKRISFAVSNTAIFEANVFDVSNFVNRYEQSNFTTWIEIIPKADGNATLLLASDAKDAYGNSLLVKINIFVNADVYDVDVSSSLTTFSSSKNLFIANKNQTFSVETKVFENVGTEAIELKELTSTMRAAFYFVPAEYQNFVSLLNASGTDVKFSSSNQFIVTSVSNLPVSIWVAVARTDNSLPITSIVSSGLSFTLYNGSTNITNQYVQKEYKFLALPKLDGVSVKQNGVETSNQLVCFKQTGFAAFDLNEIISYSAFSNQLLNPSEKTVLPANVFVSSSNESIVGFDENGSFVVSGNGSCVLTFVASDGVSTYSKQIDITILAPLAEMNFVENDISSNLITFDITDIADGYQIDLLSLSVYASFETNDTTTMQQVFSTLGEPGRFTFEYDELFSGQIVFFALEVGAVLTVII